MVTSFGHLPYDVLVYIFQEFDRPTLTAACLSSRRLNELATPLLYRNVSIHLRSNINEKQPFEAFERRPFLRQVVRGVTCRPTLNNYIRDHSVLETRAHDISSQLRSLPNVERLIFTHGSYREAETLYFLGVLSDWPKLRRIDTSSDVMKSLATLKHLQSRLPAINTLTVRWVWRSTILPNDLVFWSGPLRDLTLIRFPFEEIPDCLLQFRNLRRLSLKEGGRWSKESAQVLETMFHLQSLEDLEMNINIDSTSTSFMPTGLKNLKSLDICFCYPKGEDKAPLVDALRALVDALAGQSYLHCLKLKSLLDVKSCFRADRFMGKVLQRHGDTLRRLSLGQFRPSSSMCRKIFSCRYMKRLTIGVTRTFANDLPLYVVPTAQLEILTLCFPMGVARFSRSTVQALLGQTSSPLRTIKVRISASWRFQTTTTRWTSTASYDGDIKRAIRVTSGPVVPIQPPPMPTYNYSEEELSD